MDDKIITIENRQGLPPFLLQRVLRMVPDRDQGDKRLQRLLAFRLHNDGEAATCEFLMHHIRRFVRHPRRRSFYDFLLEGRVTPRDPTPDPGPPGAA